MSLTAGVISLVSVGAQTASLAVTAATMGTSPYAYQWYRSTTTGFSPGGGNIITGATSLTLNDTGLIPGVTYFYKNRVTDSASPAATSDAAQLAVTTSLNVLSQNQFVQSPFLGMIDMPYNFNTWPCQIDPSQTGTLYAGQPVKIVANTNGGIFSVVACTANTDACIGFLNYDVKNVGFVAGQIAEMSLKGNVMWLYATGAITQFAQLNLDVTNGGVSGADTSTDEYVGWAVDGAAAAGTLIRMYIETPSFKTF